MSTNNQTNNSQEEIDLSYIFKSVGSFLRAIELFAYRWFRFAIKNIVWIIVWALIGAALGYFLDQRNKDIYKQEIIIKTNVNSSAHLYKKIEGFVYNTKKDTILEVTIEPIIDVLAFIEGGSKNLETAKYLSENNIDLDRYKNGNQTERIYNYHLMTVYTKGKDDWNKKIARDFLAEINNEPYFLEKQKIQQEQTAQKIREFQTTLKHINAYFDKITQTETNLPKTDLTFDLDSGLADLLIQKTNAVNVLEKLAFLEQEEQKIFQDISILSNIEICSSIRKTFVLSILFVLGYFGFVTIRKRYKKYQLFSENE